MNIWSYQWICNYEPLTSVLLHLGQWIFEFTKEYVATNIWPLRFYTLASEYLNFHNEYVTTNLWPLCFYTLANECLNLQMNILLRTIDLCTFTPWPSNLMETADVNMIKMWFLRCRWPIKKQPARLTYMTRILQFVKITWLTKRMWILSNNEKLGLRRWRCRKQK